MRRRKRSPVLSYVRRLSGRRTGDICGKIASRRAGLCTQVYNSRPLPVAPLKAQESGPCESVEQASTISHLRGLE